MSKQTVFTMKFESDLREAFMTEAQASFRPASQILREIMREFVQRQREARVYEAYLHGKVTEARSQIAAGSYASAEEVEARAADRRTKLIDKAGRTNAPELAEHRPQNRIVPTLSITLRKTILKRLFSSMNFSGAPRPVWAHIPC